MEQTGNAQLAVPATVPGAGRSGTNPTAITPTPPSPEPDLFLKTAGVNLSDEQVSVVCTSVSFADCCCSFPGSGPHPGLARTTLAGCSVGHTIMYTDAITAARKRKLQGGLGAQGTLSITRPKFHSKSNDPWPRASTPGLGTPAPVSG